MFLPLFGTPLPASPLPLKRPQLRFSILIFMQNPDPQPVEEEKEYNVATLDLEKKNEVPEVEPD